MTESSNNRRAIEKWGETALAGFQNVPDLLLKKQNTLGLSNTDMMVLLNISMHWWYADKPPFPHNSSIARRMGVDTRTIERAIKRLKKLGLIKRIPMILPEGKKREGWDLEGLVEKLSALTKNDVVYSNKKHRGENVIKQ